MALIENMKGREEGSGYQRLFGDKALGFLMSRVQGAVISAGTELERLVAEKVDQTQVISDLDAFLKNPTQPQGVFLVTKKAIKSSKVIISKSAEPDFVILEIKQGLHCYIIELKDGDAFDTKKAESEKKTLLEFQQENASEIPGTVSIHFVCFNQISREEIRKGFKQKIELEECMTGREFCKILELDYDAIVNQRKEDAPKNFKYFLDSQLEIPSIREYLKENLD